MDFNLSDVGLKRIISFGGFIFFILMIFIIEKQTNFLYYININQEIEALEKIKKSSDNIELNEKINLEYSRIIDDLGLTKPFKMNDFENSINRIINKVKYGKENLSEAEKDIKIEELESELKSLNNKIETLKTYWGVGGIVVGLLLIPFFILIENLIKKIKYRIIKIRRKRMQKKGLTEKDKNIEVENKENTNE